MRKQKAFTLVELLVVIGIIALLVAILLPVVLAAWERANRVKCAANLRAIGQGLATYYHDHKQYPRRHWNYSTFPQVFALGREDDPSFGQHPLWCNVTAGIYLLVQRNYLPIEVFICPSARRERMSVDPGAEQYYRQWRDFTWARPLSSLLSYSFATFYEYGDPSDTHPEYNHEFKPPPKQPPDFALAADANNAPPAVFTSLAVQRRDPESKLRIANSRNHKQAGQNVLYMDGHVSWRTTILCGHAGDSIYHNDKITGELMPGIWGPWQAHDTVMFPNPKQWAEWDYGGNTR